MEHTFCEKKKNHITQDNFKGVYDSKITFFNKTTEALQHSYYKHLVI